MVQEEAIQKRVSYLSFTMGQKHISGCYCITAGTTKGHTDAYLCNLLSNLTFRIRGKKTRSFSSRKVFPDSAVYFDMPVQEAWFKNLNWSQLSMQTEGREMECFLNTLPIHSFTRQGATWTAKKGESDLLHKLQV